MKMAFWEWIPPCENPYTTPLLSVRSQQSWRPLPVMLLAAWVSCREVQVSPPSLERASVAARQLSSTGPQSGRPEGYRYGQEPHAGCTYTHGFPPDGAAGTIRAIAGETLICVEPGSP
jgi:hypothetical protein